MERITAFSDQGLFVAATGARPGTADADGQNVGLLHFSTPNNLPLLTAQGAEVMPGSYVIYLQNDRTVALRNTDGLTIVEAAPPDVPLEERGGGGIYECSGSYSIEIQYHNCQLCISLVCAGVWEVEIACFTIPFCDIVTGLFGIASKL